MENRGSRYEVPMPRVPWLKLQGVADTQGIGSVKHHELTDKRGRFDASVVAKIKDAIRFAFDL
jgi:mRNA interferase MazF